MIYLLIIGLFFFCLIIFCVFGPFRTVSNLYGISNNQTFPVDVVVTWVNSTDPEWIRQKNELVDTRYDNKERWNDQMPNVEGEISLCLRLILKNMPWVRKIHLVTCRPQVPLCLSADKTLQAAVVRRKITVVHHDEFYNNLQHLPTFNSESIEANMAYIKGLAEHFVYFNDDMFVTNYVSINKLFRNGIPIVYGTRIRLFAPGTMICSKQDGYFCNRKRTLNLLYKNNIKNIVQVHHHYCAHRKSMYLDAARLFTTPFEINSSSNIRTSCMYTINQFVANLGIHSNRYLYAKKKLFKSLYIGKAKYTWKNINKLFSGDELAVCVNNINSIHGETLLNKLRLQFLK